MRLLPRGISPSITYFWNSAAKNIGEIQLSFNAPLLFTGVQIGINGVTMTAFNTGLMSANAPTAFFQAAADALRKSTHEEFQGQLITRAFHVKPGKLPFKEILGQFINAKALAAEDANMYGFSVYRNDYSFVIDGSAVISGGIFIKLMKHFSSEKRMEEMAGVLKKDEDVVLQMLGLRTQ